MGRQRFTPEQIIATLRDRRNPLAQTPGGLDRSTRLHFAQSGENDRTVDRGDWQLAEIWEHVVLEAGRAVVPFWLECP